MSKGEKYKCRECGKQVTDDDLHYCHIKRLIANQLCFSCDFWMEHVELKNDPLSVRVDGEHYRINPEENTSFKGFDGQKFIINFKDGRRIVTTNLWHQGGIPYLFKSRLPDNASFEGIK